MGYRSDVAYTIRFIVEPTDFDGEKLEETEECRKSFYTFLAEAKSKDETRSCFDECMEINKDVSPPKGEGFHVDYEKMTINFLAYSVKWYPDYTDVKPHNELVALAQEWASDNDYIGGVFSRIGEEVDDTEDFTWGTGDYDWLYVRRQIVCDWVDDHS